MTDDTDAQRTTDRREHPPMGFDQPQELSLLQIRTRPILVHESEPLDDEGRLGLTIDDIPWE
ncbi:MAG: hypothetical protein OXG19_09660 [Chloroflexi bacterium]|nr:hypothetical protein [Chloroflexota bacterium]